MKRELIVLGKKIRRKALNQIYNELTYKLGIEIKFDDLLNSPRCKEDKTYYAKYRGVTEYEENGLTIYLKHVDSHLIAHEMLEGSHW